MASHLKTQLVLDTLDSEIVLAELPGVVFSYTTVDEAVQALAINSQSLHVLNIRTTRALIRIEIDGPITKHHRDGVRSYFVGHDSRIAASISIAFHIFILIADPLKRHRLWSSEWCGPYRLVIDSPCDPIA